MPPQSTCIFIAMAITLAGAWVQWRSNAYRMEFEEAMKDGKLTQRQVDRRLRWVQQGGMLLTLIGTAALLAALVLLPG